MAEEYLILTKANTENNDLNLFVGNHETGKNYPVSIDKQLDWLTVIADNIRNYRKRHV